MRKMRPEFYRTFSNYLISCTYHACATKELLTALSLVPVWRVCLLRPFSHKAFWLARWLCPRLKGPFLSLHGLTWKRFEQGVAVHGNSWPHVALASRWLLVVWDPLCPFSFDFPGILLGPRPATPLSVHRLVLRLQTKTRTCFGGPLAETQGSAAWLDGLWVYFLMWLSPLPLYL